MTRADKALVLLLRTLGVGSLFALLPVFMPLSWIAAIHRWLGLGEIPAAPVVEYLARSLSGFYALCGGLCLVVASDVDRNRPLVRWLGVGVVVWNSDVVLPMLLDMTEDSRSGWTFPATATREERAKWGAVWMSMTPAEMLAQRGGVQAAEGTVVIGGLGLGWLLRKVCEKPSV